MPSSTAGKLIVGSPAIRDGVFDQAVVFMLHHDEHGALGVVLSSPTLLRIEELLPRWIDLCSAPAVVFEGGPVEPNGFIGVALASGKADPEILMPVETDSATRTPGLAGVHTLDLEADPAIAAASVERLRIFRGHAGWGSGQLEDELARGAWFTVGAESDDIWADNPEALYEQVMLRQSGDLRYFAHAPIDLSVN